MLRRIATTITAALLTLTACGPEPFDTFDDVPADADDEALLAEFVGDDGMDEGGEGGEGGMGGQPVPDMGQPVPDMPAEDPAGACCICDTTNPADSWCEQASDPQDCADLHHAIGMPVTWQTGCTWVGGELICPEPACA